MGLLCSFCDECHYITEPTAEQIEEEEAWGRMPMEGRIGTRYALDVLEEVKWRSPMLREKYTRVMTAFGINPLFWRVMR